MKEMDFEGFINYSSGKSWSEHGTSIQYLLHQSTQCIRNNGTLNIKRNARKKGQVLYQRLKAIVDEANAYAEKINKVNQKRSDLKNALAESDNGGNPQERAKILGQYAYSLYYEEPKDAAQAEQYAKEALRLDGADKNAQEVLNAVRQAREAEAEEKAERERQERERQARREEAERQEAAEKERQRKIRQTGKVCFRAGVINAIVSVVPLVLMLNLIMNSLAFLYVVGSAITYTRYRYARALNGGNAGSGVFGNYASGMSVMFELCMWPLILCCVFFDVNGPVNEGAFMPIFLLGAAAAAADTIACWRIGKRRREILTNQV